MNEHSGMDEQAFSLLMKSLASIEKKVDDGFMRVNGTLQDHEKRIRAHEDIRMKVIGGIAVVVVLISLLSRLVEKVFGI